MYTDVGIKQKHHLDFGGTTYPLRMKVENVSGLIAPLTYYQDGVLVYLTNAGSKRLMFWDSSVPSWVTVPRKDYNEVITGQWAFNYASGSPFTVGNSTLVSSLNSDLLDGYHAGNNSGNIPISNSILCPDLNAELLNGFATGQSVTQDTVAVRYTGGRLRVGDPIDNSDAIPLGYLESRLAGIVQVYDPVELSTVSALPSYTIAGNTLTASGNGSINSVSALDSVASVRSLILNDRVLVKDESSKEYNGIYYVSQVGDGSNPWKLTRTTDIDEDSEVVTGGTVFVTSGDTYGSSGWALRITADPFTLNVDDIEWVQVSGAYQIQAGNGMVKSGNNMHFAQSSAYTVGSIFYAATATPSTVAQLSTAGLLQLRGAGTAPNSITGTTNYVPKWSATAPYLTTSSNIYDDGTSVLIGTTTSMYNSSIETFKSAAGRHITCHQIGDTTHGPLLTIQRSRVASAALQAGDIIGTVAFRGQDTDGGWYQLVAGISASVNSDDGSADLNLMAHYLSGEGDASSPRWRVRGVSGALESIGSQTVRTNTGALTIETGGGGGQIFMMPVGTRVGINTITPDYNLHLVGSGTAYFRLEDYEAGSLGGYLYTSASGVVLGSTASRSLSLYTADTQRIGIATTGDITLHDFTGASDRMLGVDSAGKVKVLTSVPGSAGARTYATNIGDTISTVYTVTHSLGTEDVVAIVREAASNKEFVNAIVKVTGTNTISVTFLTAPALNQYRVVVAG